MKVRRLVAAFAVSSLFGAVAFAQQATGPPGSLTLLAAVTSALENHPQLHIQQREVDLSRARKQQATGAFDTVLTGGAGQSSVTLPFTQLQEQQLHRAGLLFGDNRTTTIQYGGGLTRLLRNGITLEPSATVTRIADRFDSPNGLEQSAVSFDVVLPLLRGRGRDVVGAQESAADLNVGAALLDYNETIAERILDVVSAYWNAVTAGRLLALGIEAEERGRRLADETGRLVAGGRVPAADMNQLWANLASRTADRLSAEQNLVEARQALALAMGLDAAGAAALPALADDLPDLSPDELARLNALDADALVRQALVRRADYLAAATRVRASAALVPAARNGLRPQLDLHVGGGYSALQEGLQLQRIFSNVFYEPSGPNASVSFQYSFAPARHEAAGRLAEAEALVREASLRRDDLARSVAAGVVTAVSGVRRAAAARQKAAESVGYYRAALEGEQEKQKLGRSSLIDLLTVEDRLTDGLQRESRARLRCAVSVAQLRFSSGAFIDPEQQKHTIARDDLTTVPR